MPGSFVDSNVLLYLISDDERKARRAEAFLKSGAKISVQVLNEVANVARRKKKITWPVLHEFVASLRDAFEVLPITIETHELGLRLAQRYQLTTYDAVIAAAALLSGCDVLWTEDMHHGLHIANRLLVTNPFHTF